MEVSFLGRVSCHFVIDQCSKVRARLPTLSNWLGE